MAGLCVLTRKYPGVPIFHKQADEEGLEVAKFFEPMDTVWVERSIYKEGPLDEWKSRGYFKWYFPSECKDAKDMREDNQCPAVLLMKNKVRDSWNY